MHFVTQGHGREWCKLLADAHDLIDDLITGAAGEQAGREFQARIEKSINADNKPLKARAESEE